MGFPTFQSFCHPVRLQTYRSQRSLSSNRLSEEGKGLNELLDTEIRDHETVGTERSEEALGKQGFSPASLQRRHPQNKDPSVPVLT